MKHSVCDLFGSLCRPERVWKCHICEQCQTVIGRREYYVQSHCWSDVGLPPPCQWLASILLVHTPGLWPGYAVATLRGLCPWRAVRGVAVRCRVNQMKNVCNMLNLRIVDCRKCSCYVACCEKQGLQISWKCVAEVAPKCCALIHKGIYWLKWKLKVYIWHKTFSLIHTLAKWYSENRRSKWYIKKKIYICQIQLWHAMLS